MQMIDQFLELRVAKIKIPGCLLDAVQARHPRFRACILLTPSVSARGRNESKSGLVSLLLFTRSNILNFFSIVSRSFSKIDWPTIVFQKITQFRLEEFRQNS